MLPYVITLSSNALHKQISQKETTHKEITHKETALWEITLQGTIKARAL